VANATANDQLYRDGILDQDRSSAYKHPFLNKRYCHGEFVFLEVRRQVTLPSQHEASIAPAERNVNRTWDHH
jgi:hypothetical protein